MDKYKFVAVVLVYRNAEDLVECVESYKKMVNSCKIIVVNAYYDDDSMNHIKSIAIENKCDFLNIENKGYSYGNNYGIDYANSHYCYEYVIVSNPDITINKFDDSGFAENIIYAPKIIARSGKNQNPMVIKRNHLSEYLIYKGMKNSRKAEIILGLVLSKIIRSIQKSIKGKIYEIYQAHGSFVILHKDVVKKIKPIYDENMFLFAEEGVLAIKAKQAGCKTFYTESVVITHKEDGSMALGNFKVNDELVKANTYFYEHYCCKR